MALILEWLLKHEMEMLNLELPSGVLVVGDEIHEALDELLKLEAKRFGVS